MTVKNRSKRQGIRKCYYVFLPLMILSLLLFSLCQNDPGSSPNQVMWQGAWENDTELYGTFTLNMTFEGTNMDLYGGSGTIAGSITLTRWDGVDLVESAVSGSWENRKSDNHDRLDYSVETGDSSLSLIDYINYETAAELTNSTYTIGAITFESNTGSWHTSYPNIELPVLDSALLIDETGQFLDITTVGSEIYATVYDDPNYQVVRINITNGSTASVPAADCAEPHAIAYDGSNIWIVGKVNTSDTDFSLFCYENATLSTLVAGYPVPHSDLVDANALSADNGTLYCHNGNILSSAIGTITTELGLDCGKVTTILEDSFGSLPGLSRTEKISAAPGFFYTTYFAPGGVWCEIHKFDVSGSLVTAYFCPVDATGPLDIDGDTLYLIQGDLNRMYAIQL